MQYSLSGLYSTKTLYHLEYTEKYRDNFFKYQGQMFLNIKKVLVKISEEQR